MACAMADADDRGCPGVKPGWPSGMPGIIPGSRPGIPDIPGIGKPPSMGEGRPDGLRSPAPGVGNMGALEMARPTLIGRPPRSHPFICWIASSADLLSSYSTNP